MAAYISGVFQDDEKASEMNLTLYNPPRFSPLGINFDTIMHYIDAQLYLYLTVLISDMLSASAANRIPSSCGTLLTN